MWPSTVKGLWLLGEMEVGDELVSTKCAASLERRDLAEAMALFSDDDPAVTNARKHR